MKKMILGLFISLVTFQAHADKDYLCFDAKTGADAGKLAAVGSELDQNGNGKLIYSNLSTSTDGWLLTITEDGKLYNADPMVQHGKDFYVGEVGYENFYLLLTISGRKMYCK